jgi:ribose-phosphate pyrophosphokinase
MKLFSGSSHQDLAKGIAASLGMELGCSQTHEKPNENLEVRIMENVRESDVFYIQTACSPLHSNIFEMFIAIDALKSASARRVTAVIPYMPYVRADKKDRSRISISVRLFADLLVASGADRVLTIDLHAPQVQGFFRVPTDQLMAAGIICDYLCRKDLSNAVIIASDAGEAKDVGRYANRLDLPIGIIDKRRFNGQPQSDLIGDVEGKLALVIDDEISSAKTLVEASNFLMEKGAKDVKAVATHGAFSGNALEIIESSPVSEVIVTDSIPIETESSKITVLSVGGLFARAIRRIHDGNSLSALFR